MKIPKIFHRIWIGGNPIPQEYVDYGKTWEDLHQNWKMYLWTDDNLPELINQELYDSLEGIVLKSNILRVELLYQYGGVYIDTDFECYKNIEPLIKDLDIFSCGEKDGIVGNAIMGSTPKHPTWEKVMSGWEESIRKNREYPSNIQTGVVYMTRTIDKEHDMIMLPSKYFFPTPVGTITDIGLSECYPEAYGHHHWGASWVTDETKKQWIEWSEKHGGKEWYK